MQMEANPDEDDIVTIEIMTDIQLILAVLCESDMHRKVKINPCDVMFTFIASLK